MSRRKKKPSVDAEHYEFIKAFVEGGCLRWEYRIEGGSVGGRQSHDEDVSDWTDEQIASLTRQILSVEADDPVKVRVIHW